MTREEALKILKSMSDISTQGEALDMAIEAMQTEVTKKKAELKKNGDWDCPNAGCNECDHHRSVEWCSLAIPNHEEIDETYKMVNEAFFEGFNAAEKQYRLLIETVEELDKELAEIVSRDDYTETDGVITIEKQSAMDVEEIKYIIIRSPNYTRYFYNESTELTPIIQGEWILDGDTPICSECGKEPCWSSEGYDFTDYCPNCGAEMKSEVKDI